MKPLKSAFVAAALAMLAAPGWSHDDATLDKTKAPNGGQLRMAGIYHYELVVAPPSAEARSAPVVVFVTDHAGAKIATAGATGSATLLSGGQKVIVALKPVAENRMHGEGVYKSGPELKAIVSIAMPGKPAEQARFEPFGARAASQ